MQLNVSLDKDISSTSQALIFSSDSVTITPEDIEFLKEKDLLKLIKGDDLPEQIDCTCLVHYFHYNKAKVMLYNEDLMIPAACYDEPFLNKDLLERAEQHNGSFRLEFFINPCDSFVQMNIGIDSMKT